MALFNISIVPARPALTLSWDEKKYDYNWKALSHLPPGEICFQSSFSQVVISHWMSSIITIASLCFRLNGAVQLIPHRTHNCILLLNHCLCFVGLVCLKLNEIPAQYTCLWSSKVTYWLVAWRHKECFSWNDSCWYVSINTVFRIFSARQAAIILNMLN